jgi:hypothetical protein
MCCNLLHRGADWGADRVWCHAAEKYNERINQLTREAAGLGNLSSNEDQRSIACAVIIGNTSVKHLDTKSMFVILFIFISFYQLFFFY